MQHRKERKERAPRNDDWRKRERLPLDWALLAAAEAFKPW